MPVFFIQDGMKFPDLIHAVKPEPHHEMPQAASAHDTFWDFISMMPESAHMIFWVMSDRALPRSFRMMEGFGVHTFRLVDAEGNWRFVKFHWKPVLGLHAVLWDEAQKISGKDPDFHRRDLWEAIESGMYPEWELGLQVVEAQDEHEFDFDLLDPTKLIPEELIPVQPVGRLTLNRNPDNFFAETRAGRVSRRKPRARHRCDERSAAASAAVLVLGHAVDPPGWSQLPRDSHQPPAAARHQLSARRPFPADHQPGRVAYEPNTLAGNHPAQVPGSAGGYVSVPEPLHGQKVRGRSPSFHDHFSQARLFLASQSEHERRHLVRAFCFELGKVDTEVIRERMVGILAHVDMALAPRSRLGWASWRRRPRDRSTLACRPARPCSASPQRARTHRPLPR